jgi:hypothetical protein
VSENDSNETTYQSQFGIEVERREAHLAALPGSVYREWFESLNRASKVFSGNSSELEKHLTKFVGTPTFVSELSDDFGDESARLLHNYLAALATLRDTQRSIHHKLSPEPDDNDPNRTRWEVKVWDPKRKQLYGFGNDAMGISAPAVCGASLHVWDRLADVRLPCGDLAGILQNGLHFRVVQERLLNLAVLRPVLGAGEQDDRVGRRPPDHGHQHGHVLGAVLTGEVTPLLD